jgi:tetratricopeptide (TPR) repeat protein
VVDEPDSDEPDSDVATTEIHDNTFNGPTPTHTGGGDQHNYFTASPERRRDVLAGLPPEPAGFVGRGEQVAELLELLDPRGAGGAVLVCAVGGLAGIGKSALAIHVARRAVEAGWFHGGVWLNLRGFDPQAAPVQATGAVPELLRARGWDGDLPSSLPEQVQLYHSVLAELARRGLRVLLMLDNVADVEQVAELLPRDQTHRAVVTSRMTLASLGARMLDLDVLSVDDAVALLATALRDAHPHDLRAEDEVALTGLATVCGRLPLALQIAAALLKASPKRPVASLTERLTDEKQRLERLRFPDSALRPGVRAALHLSYERLPESQQRILRQLSVDPGPDIATATLAALAELSVAEAEEELYALDRARLIACGEHERWSMHDLVRLYARELLEADPEEHAQAGERLLDYYLATADAANEHMTALPGQPVPKAFAGRGDALAWFDANRENLVGAVHQAVDGRNLDIAMRLPVALAEYFSWRRLFPEWIETQTVAVDAARTLNDRFGEGITLNNLGIALLETRRFQEAIDAHQQAADIFRETGDQYREDDALNQLRDARNEMANPD